jgi:uncharacterized protein
MELSCPKCQGTMRTYERNGVHVDQCGDCRGIFLDRGELDRLIDAENDWHGAARPSEQSRHQERPSEQSRHQERPSEHSGQQTAASGAGLGAVVGEVLRQVQGSKSHSSSSDYYAKKRKKEFFLGDLFG